MWTSTGLAFGDVSWAYLLVAADCGPELAACCRLLSLLYLMLLLCCLLLCCVLLVLTCTRNRQKNTTQVGLYVLTFTRPLLQQHCLLLLVVV
jgi:hypothetical protein